MPSSDLTRLISNVVLARALNRWITFFINIVLLDWTIFNSAEQRSDSNRWWQDDCVGRRKQFSFSVYRCHRCRIFSFEYISIVHTKCTVFWCALAVFDKTRMPHTNTYALLVSGECRCVCVRVFVYLFSWLLFISIVFVHRHHCRPKSSVVCLLDEKFHLRWQFYLENEKHHLSLSLSPRLIST